MSEEKPATVSAIIAAMKEAGFATKTDVEDVVHEQLTEFYAGRVQPEFDNAEAKNEERFQKLEQGMKTIEIGQAHIGDDIKGLEGELAATVSKREFLELKTRVERVEKTN